MATNRNKVRARYARKLAYAAQDDGEAPYASYIAMLEFRQRRDGPAVLYALYRRVMYYKGRLGKDEAHILYLRPSGTWQEMVARYWMFPPQGTDKNDFPGYESKRWRATTTWLNRVASGGWYEYGGYDSQSGTPGRWMRIGTPSLWTNHRKRKRLRFGLPQHIVYKLETEIAAIKKEIVELRDEQEKLGVWDEDLDDHLLHQQAITVFEELGELIAALEEECEVRANQIRYNTELMRREVRSKFPEPKGLTPKRDRHRAMRAGRSSIFG